MTTPHKATPEQWAWQEEWARDPHADQDSSCILELRDRIAAAEQRIQEMEGNSQPTPNERQIRSSAPAGGLIEMRHALVKAEAALADIGDAEREPGDDLAWCEKRAAQALPVVRAALGAAANHPESPDSSPAPAGGLMQAVGAAICTIADCGDTPSNWAPEARAAILAVAKWFDTISYGATASILRQEVERHG
jgi:hypothetical protein